MIEYLCSPPPPQDKANAVRIAYVPEYSFYIALILATQCHGRNREWENICKQWMSSDDCQKLTRHTSQFINLASGSNLRVGLGLESATAEVKLANEFTLDGRVVTLIDTPGFDDTSKSDTEILKIIAAFLATT